MTELLIAGLMVFSALMFFGAIINLAKKAGKAKGY